MQLSLLLTRFYKFLSSNKKNYVYRPLWIYWIVLLILTSYPSDGVPMFGIEDKFEHLFAYLLLAVLIQLTLHFQSKFLLLKKNYVVATIIIGTLYGIADELHQYFIPGRYCDLLDLASNFIGIILAVILVNYFINIASDIK